ncbi:MAG: hypothetical protein ABR986_01970 [Methanomassiliicoccales archaeon]|jgi:hypothetical protein
MSAWSSQVLLEMFEKRFSDRYEQESTFMNCIDVRTTGTARPKQKK